MTTWAAIAIGKFVSWFSKTFNFGAGATWPGEIALKIDPNILSEIAPKNIILVAGTNGKTTTALMIKTILEKSGATVVYNASGANLLNGIVSAIIISPASHLTASSKQVWGVLEIDENSLPIVLKFVQPKIIILLNLFRDQLDRYGEVDTIAQKWKIALARLAHTTLILNSDDPQIASLGSRNTIYFGLNDTKLFQRIPEHAMDSQFCPHCSNRLEYTGTFYSHLGHWSCPQCRLSRPKPQITDANFPLEGTYNRYNTLAATAVAQTLGIKPNLAGFHPAFGRQEEINDVRVMLSKNPASFNESLRTVLTSLSKGGPAKSMKTIQLLLVLNDRVPDGQDVSWIWDVDFEMIPKNISLGVSGDRAYDLALRLKYADLDSQVVNLTDGVKKAANILATYTAMLEVRKILTGRKIL